MTANRQPDHICIKIHVNSFFSTLVAKYIDEFFYIKQVEMLKPVGKLTKSNRDNIFTLGLWYTSNCFYPLGS